MRPRPWHCTSSARTRPRCQGHGTLAGDGRRMKLRGISRVDSMTPAHTQRSQSTIAAARQRVGTKRRPGPCRAQVLATRSCWMTSRPLPALTGRDRRIFASRDTPESMAATRAERWPMRSNARREAAIAPATRCHDGYLAEHSPTATRCGHGRRKVVVRIARGPPSGSRRGGIMSAQGSVWAPVLGRHDRVSRIVTCRGPVRGTSRPI